ncbi:hypothetical protein RHECNPAF_280039 [Rhizobium etli CNPAF512]|nr:hypothetical protein RHECNPAF_280039 [Rhizobium etli CNPAF512]
MRSLPRSPRSFQNQAMRLFISAPTCRGQPRSTRSSSTNTGRGIRTSDAIRVRVALNLPEFYAVDHFLACRRVYSRRVADHQRVAVEEIRTDQVGCSPSRIPARIDMVDDLVILQRIGGGIGQHGIEKGDLLVIGGARPLQRGSMTVHHQRHHAPVGVVGDIADGIGSHGVGHFARCHDLSRP